MLRFLDIFFSLVGLIVLLPLFLIVAVVIAFDSKGGVFYLQWRVGRDGKEFRIFKFRTMHLNSDQLGGLTIGARDSRITASGRWLRQYKLDELPQLINVLKGDMSLVGPRPEITKYVDQYTPEQRKILTVKPGITDFASIEYFNENEILGNAADPDHIYIHEVMPAKIALNMRFINDPSLKNYFLILGKTLSRIF